MQESGEMYLETILILSKTHPEVHSIDVAKEMNFSKPSVSRAMKILKDGGYIDIDNNSHIWLTDEGRAIAEKMYERHSCISKYLMQLGVDEETAVEDACKIEHVISEKSFAAVKAFAEKFNK
ncbi:MAG: metal-dependent transcriptional regulator [Treponemataceae bacterium]|nr:metal-dependent transcriptional regulator [Treponemataceae bacterium]